MSEHMPTCPPEFWAETIRLAHTNRKPHAWIARELGIQLKVVRLPKPCDLDALLEAVHTAAQRLATDRTR